MKLRETKKLHYNKYLYKLSIPNQCAAYFRTEFQKDGQLGYARQKLDVLHQHYEPNSQHITVPWGSVSWSKFNRQLMDCIPVDHYYDAIEIYRHLKKHEKYKVRTEIFSLILYSNDRQFLINLANKLKHPYIEFWEPDPENTNLLKNEKNIILVNRVPKYEYKITLGKRKGSPSLAKWIESNPKLAKMGNTAIEECYNKGWVKGYYFFVRDYKTLTLAQLMIGDNIQRIDKMVYVEN